MKCHRFAHLVRQFLFAFAALGVGAGESMAQDIGRCDGVKAPCVEVLLRYYDQAPTEGERTFANSKVQILDPVSKKALPVCRICDPTVDPSCNVRDQCTNLQGKTLYDASNLILLQTEYKSPGCYYICSGGWCGRRCF
jgi:hypothetical protein